MLEALIAMAIMGWSLAIFFGAMAWVFWVKAQKFDAFKRELSRPLGISIGCRVPECDGKVIIGAEVTEVALIRPDDA